MAENDDAARRRFDEFADDYDLAYGGNWGKSVALYGR
jgi:hypothetical protein